MSTGNHGRQPRKEADHERGGVVYAVWQPVVLVYCEHCGRYIRVEHGDDLLVCLCCGCPLMYHVVMELG